MKYTLGIFLFAYFACASLSSCKQNDGDNVLSSADTGRVYMEFFNVAGGSKLNLNNQWYRNANGDSFTVSKFNYYISNVRLNSVTGKNFTEPESYHLIEHTSNPSEMAFNMKGVPVGKYASVTLMVGVDSLRNVSGAQTGALDPILGNFWSWNTGYIMVKFEGTSPQAPTSGRRLMLHSGGFSGPDNVLKELTFPFSEPIEVKASQSPHIHVQADLLQMFKSPNVIDFSKTTTIMMPGPDAKKIADNYTNMFSVTYAGY